MPKVSAWFTALLLALILPLIFLRVLILSTPTFIPEFILIFIHAIQFKRQLANPNSI
jgi:hypothetical protein